jgi:hypothetical protein
MTTGATGQLGLALPVQGELSGTWGDTVNNGITQYTNIAIAGTLTLTGDGAVTLANTTGDASASNITSTLAGAGTVTAQFAAVRVSGTTTTKVVTGPSYSKTYLVDNASSFAVTFKASGQTGVSVAAAEKVSVYFNGTDYVKIAGTIANAAGSNTQIQFNNGGLFGASANLTWDGTTLSSTQVNITGQGTLRLQDTTGGEYVGLRAPGTLGASYTLTWPADDGTSGQALITDGSGVLSWSTAASGDVYGPGSATDNAVARFDGTTGKLIQNGVVIVGDTGAVTGVTDLTTSGYVKAGTFSAVTGALTAFVSSSGGIYSYYTGGSGYIGSYADNSATFSPLVFDGSYLAWRPAGSEQMRLTSTGLGIGTSSPSTLLTMVGTTGKQSIIKLQAASGSAGGFKRTIINFRDDTGAAGYDIVGLGDGNNALTFDSVASGTGTTRLTLDSSGNLGLGVTPSAWASTYRASQVGLSSSLVGITNDVQTHLTTNAYFDGTNWVYIATSPASRYMQDNNIHKWFNAASGSGGATATFTQAMTLGASGNLGVGTTSPVSRIDARSTSAVIGNYQQIQAFSTDAAAINLGGGIALGGNYSGSSTIAVFGNIVGRKENGTDGNYAGYLAFGTNAQATGVVERARIDSSGNLLVGNTSGYRGGKLVVSAANVSQTSTLANIHVTTTDSQGADLGGSIGMGGQVGGDETPFGLISGRKENGTSGNYAGYLAFATQGSGAAITEKARITSGGSLLVGKTSGLSTVDVVDIGNGGVRVTNGTTDLRLLCGASEAYLYNASNVPTVFSVNTTERARINTSGQFGVGTSSPTAIIHSASSGLGDGGGLRIQNTGSGGATYSIWPTATVNGEGAGKLIISGPSGNVVTVTTGGFVGVGTTSPAGRLHVDGINGPLRISGSGYATNPVEFTLGLYTSTRAYMQLPGSGSSSGSIEIWNGGTTPISIFNNYGIGLTATPTSGMGIMFPATQSASSDANTLDDYEEGTFTPDAQGTTTLGTATYSTQYGVYTKIGNTVSFNIVLAWSSHTGTGNLNIGGLPFTQRTSSGERYTYTIVAETLTYSGELVSLNSGANALITLFQQSSGAGLSNVSMDANVSYLVISGTYFV